MKKHKHHRHLVNYLLQPLVQLRIGIATIVLTCLGFGALSLYIYNKMAGFTDVIVTLTESDDAVRVLIGDYLNTTGFVALGIVIAVLIINTLATIYFTHKMVGPTVAFRRHLVQLQAGSYDQRVVLRRADAFGEVAKELNRLAETLEEKHGTVGKKSA